MTRQQEYGYTIDLPDGWSENDDYVMSPQGGQLRILESNVVAGTTLDQFAGWIRDNLRGDWWASASVFDITHFGKRQAGGQEFYSLKYQVQESPEFCLLDVEEAIVVGASLPGPAHGFRVRHQACDSQLRRGLAPERRRALDSFRGNYP